TSARRSCSRTASAATRRRSRATRGRAPRKGTTSTRSTPSGCSKSTSTSTRPRARTGSATRCRPRILGLPTTSAASSASGWPAAPPDPLIGPNRGSLLEEAREQDLHRHCVRQADLGGHAVGANVEVLAVDRELGLVDVLHHAGAVGGAHLREHQLH